MSGTRGDREKKKNRKENKQSDSGDGSFASIAVDDTEAEAEANAALEEADNNQSSGEGGGSGKRKTDPKTVDTPSTPKKRRKAEKAAADKAAAEKAAAAWIADGKAIAAVRAEMKKDMETMQTALGDAMAKAVKDALAGNDAEAKARQQKDEEEAKRAAVIKSGVDEKNRKSAVAFLTVPNLLSFCPRRARLKTSAQRREGRNPGSEHDFTLHRGPDESVSFSKTQPKTAYFASALDMVPALFSFRNAVSTHNKARSKDLDTFLVDFLTLCNQFALTNCLAYWDRAMEEVVKANSGKSEDGLELKLMNLPPNIYQVTMHHATPLVACGKCDTTGEHSTDMCPLAPIGKPNGKNQRRGKPNAGQRRGSSREREHGRKRERGRSDRSDRGGREKSRQEPGGQNDPLCGYFNAGKCRFSEDQCRKQHRCKKCHGSHPTTRCGGRGGRGRGSGSDSD
jgi:hypothetical protein